MKAFIPKPIRANSDLLNQPFRRQVGVLSDVVRWLSRGETVAFSIAPTFPGVVGADLVSQWIGRLHKIGAARVEEASVVLKQVIEMRYRAVENQRGWLTSCPRAAQFLHSRGLSEHLLTVPTPMGLHARQLRRELPLGAKIVFIGPCRYKHFEAQGDPEGPDATLVYGEFARWLGSVKAVPTGFGRPAPCESRMAPLVEGVSGLSRVSRLVNSGSKAMGQFELLGCKEGCLAGPSPISSTILLERQRQLLKFASQNAHSIYGSSISPA